MDFKLSVQTYQLLIIIYRGDNFGDEHQFNGHYLIPVDPWQYRVKIEVLVIDIHHMINLYKDSVLKGWKTDSK